MDYCEELTRAMSEPFNPEKYEQLHGMKLGLYALEVAKNGQLPPNCLDYVKTNASRWDGQHLEMGLFFLSKLDSVDANHEIARHIDHPLQHIRYTVLMQLDRVPVDDFILAKVRSRLEAETNDFEKNWIRDLNQRLSAKSA